MRWGALGWMGKLIYEMAWLEATGSILRRQFIVEYRHVSFLFYNPFRLIKSRLFIHKVTVWQMIHKSQQTSPNKLLFYKFRQYKTSLLRPRGIGKEKEPPMPRDSTIEHGKAMSAGHREGKIAAYASREQKRESKSDVCGA